MKNNYRAILIILLVSFGHFWHDIFTAFVIPLMPVLKSNLGLTYLQTSLILIAVRIPSLLSANIAGYAEKHNPKWFVIICPLITSISITLLGLANSYLTVMILVFISGLSAAGFHVPVPTLLKKSAPNRIGLAMTSFQIGGEAARTMGPIIVVLILSTIGLNKMHYLIPVSILVSLGFYYSFNKIDISLEHKDKKQGSIIETFKEGWWLFLLIGGISLHKSILNALAKSFLPMYLMDSGFSLLKANGALALVQGATVAGVIVGGIFIDKIGAKKILYIVLVAATIFSGIFVFTPGVPLYPILVLIGFFSFASMPAIYTLIQGKGFKFPTTANGVFMSLNFGITSLMLLVTGKLSDLFTIGATYKILGLGVFLGIPLILMLKKSKD